MSVFFDGTRGDAPRLKDISPNSAEAVIDLVASEDEATRSRLARIVRAIDWSAGGDGGEDGDGDGHLGELGGSEHSSFGHGGPMGLFRILSGSGGRLEEGWHPSAWAASFWVQVYALTLRNWTLLLRHPLLMATNLGATTLVGCVCAWVFWQLDCRADPCGLELGSGVLQRMGLLFFLGAHFLLTGLASLGVWRQEKVSHARILHPSPTPESYTRILRLYARAAPAWDTCGSDSSLAVLPVPRAVLPVPARSSPSLH